MSSILIVFLLLWGLIEWYTFRGLKSRWNNWKTWKKSTLQITFLFFLGLGIFSMIMMMTTGQIFERFILNFWFTFVIWNFFTKTTLAVVLLIDDFRRLILYSKRKFKSQDKGVISRSDFLLKTGIGVAAVPLFGLGWGMAAGPYRYKVFQEKIHFSNLPSSFEGLKIVQISDIHAGSFYNTEAVEKGIDLIMSQNADVIFFTGDLVNDRASEMDPYLEMFQRIQAPMGVYSIMGNHDYGDYASWNSEEEKKENDEEFEALHQKLGWKLLRNEHVYLQKKEDKIAVVGVENWGKNFIQKGNLATAKKGCDAPFKILLSHDPTHFDHVVKEEHPDINLTLSGHTHGAQIGIETAGFKWSPASLRYSKWAGLYEENGQYIYINRGFGFIGYAGRLGIMPEITVLELYS
jgi:uncharacterized protein